VVHSALASGHEVTAATRRPDGFPISDPRLAVTAADVTDPAAVSTVVDGAGAVISTFGVPYSRQPISVYSRGIAAIIAAMGTGGIGRLVCVSSSTVATEPAPGDSLLWRRIGAPLVRRVIGRTLYDDMERMEAAVRASGLDWTIVRPGGLFDADRPPTSRSAHIVCAGG
jgi:nucleoside-diphosphate-sugar epimerase